MTQIEKLQALDLDKVKPDLLKNEIQQLLKDYEQEEDKELFFKEAGENIFKLYGLVEKYSPKAIRSDEKTEKKPRKKRGPNKKIRTTQPEPVSESPKEDKEAEAKAEREKQAELEAKAEAESKARKANSKKAMEEIKEIGKEIEACRQVIREYNKKKKEAEGKEPVKKTRLTKLKEKLLGIAGLIPDNLKEDKDTRDKTEKILLGTLGELKKAWRMNLIKPAQEAIKEKFDQLEEKQQKKEEQEAA